MLVAAALPAIVTAVCAAALAPDRVGHCVQRLHRRRWVVAGDHQLARNRALLGGLVSNHHAQTRARVQGGGKWVVDQLPVAALALERDTGDVQRGNRLRCRWRACVRPGSRPSPRRSRASR
jgi:hypothetical protein